MVSVRCSRTCEPGGANPTTRPVSKFVTSSAPCAVPAHRNASPSETSTSMRRIQSPGASATECSIRPASHLARRLLIISLRRAAREASRPSEPSSMGVGVSSEKFSLESSFSSSSPPPLESESVVLSLLSPLERQMTKREGPPTPTGTLPLPKVIILEVRITPKEPKGTPKGTPKEAKARTARVVLLLTTPSVLRRGGCAVTWLDMEEGMRD